MSQNIKTMASGNNPEDETINRIEVIVGDSSHHQSQKKATPQSDMFRKYIRKVPVEIPALYTNGQHGEYKSEVQRIMKNFLECVKIYERKLALLNSIDNVLSTLHAVQLDGVTFADDQVVEPAKVVQGPCANPCFQENVYQLLEETYQRLPPSTWVCPYRRSDLVQNRGNIVEQLAQTEADMVGIANNLSEFFSKLIKSNAHKTVYEFVSSRLEDL